MNFRRLRDEELSMFAANIVNLLNGPELSAIDPNVRAALVTAFGSSPASLATKAAEAMIAEDERKARVSERNAESDGVTILVAQVRDMLRACQAPPEQFELAGFEPPGQRVTMYIGQDPTDLSVTGFSNGVNRGKFQGNNRHGSVVYEIWRRDGRDGEWAPRMITKKRSFTDLGVTPGQYYEYRVRAIASKNISNYSNSAIVYGAL